MSKGLEALNKIIDMASEPNGYLNFQNAVDTPYYQIIEKELKALEIIKEKKVEVNILEDCITCEEYNDFIKHRVWFQEEYTITQEEYALLKEVLYENF